MSIDLKQNIFQKKNLLVYKSSAGSGKTADLVKMYLKLSLSSDNPYVFKSILAITFTNKAVNEMRERLFLYLDQIAHDKIEKKNVHILEFLLEQLKIPKENLVKRANKVLKIMLYDYSDISISTMDSFDYGLINSFRYELNIPDNFNVILSNDIIISQAIGKVISQVGINKKLTSKLLSYSMRQLQIDKGTSLNDNLIRFYKTFYSSKNIREISKIENFSSEEIEEITDVIKNELKSIELDYNRKIEDFNTFRKNNGIEDQDLKKYCIQQINIFNNFLKKGDYKLYKITKDAIKGDFPIFFEKRKEKDPLDFKIAEYFIELHKLLMSNNYFLKKELVKCYENFVWLAQYVRNSIKEYYESNYSFSLDEFKKIINHIVRTQPVPFIYFKIGNRYNHYLIDEFQDTSVISWHNLVPIIEDSLSHGKENLLVGDAKQSIYSFKGGEVNLISKLPKIYESEEEPFLKNANNLFSQQYQPVERNDNYRSKNEIIHFNNSFFKYAKSFLSEKYRTVYNEIEQVSKKKNNEGGTVVIELLEEGKQEKKELLEYVTKRVIKIIRETLKKKRNKNQMYKQSDIAILCDNNKDLKEITSGLAKEEIDFISPQSLKVIDSTKVKFIINCLELLTVRQPAFTTSVIDFQLKRITQKSDKEILRIKTKLLNKQQFLPMVSVLEMVEAIIQICDLEKDATDIYIRSFVEIVFLFCSEKQESDTFAFLDYWYSEDIEGFKISNTQSIDSVNITTVHKSKGLSYPVVIYPIIKKRNERKDNFIFFNLPDYIDLPLGIIANNKNIYDDYHKTITKNLEEKRQLELLNLAYVAFTRPEEHLHIVTFQTVGDKQEKVIDYLNCFLKRQPNNKIDENTYVFGDKHKQTVSEQKIDTTIVKNNSKIIELNKMTLVKDWRERLRISYEAPIFWEEISRITLKDKGTLVHKILSESQNEKKAQSLLDRYVFFGYLSKDDELSIRDLIEKIFKNSKLKKWFEEPNFRNESTILTPKGISYIPDKIIIRDEEIIVIDFKTGEKKEAHYKQVKEYESMLDILYNKKVKSTLVYLKESLEIIELF